MKKSSEWVRQSALDKMLDRLIEEVGCTPAELKPYDAGKALGIDTSGEFYKKVRDWKQRRAAENDTPMLEVPPHVQAEFRETVDRFSADMMTSFLRAVRAVGGDFNRAATLRVADAERRAEDAEAEVDGLLDNWTTAEAERDVALARAVELEQARDEAQRRGDFLTVRLEEREALLKTVKLTTYDDDASYGPAPTDEEWAAIVNAGDHLFSGASIIDPALAPADPGMADVATAEQEPPAAIDADRRKDGQAAMPPVTNDAADQANGAGDDQD